MNFQNQDEQDICIQQHQELENREARIEFNNLKNENSCKTCGVNEYKFFMCESCYFSQRNDFVKKIGFVAGWITGSFLTIFISINGALIYTFGISAGAIICNLLKIKF